MPPTPGVFAVPYGSAPNAFVTSSAQVVGPGLPGARNTVQLNQYPASNDSAGQEMYGPGIGHGIHSQNTGNSQFPFSSSQPPQPAAGPSSRHAASGAMEESMSRKEKKRKESLKLKEAGDRRDDGRHFTESISALHHTAHALYTRPEVSAQYHMRLYPLAIERSSLTSQFEWEERYSLECAQVAYDEEKERVEDEWKRGRERVRERLLEGIEERRKRAREEKEGEGTVGDAALDSHSRPPITRKLRNKLGTSPPPTPQTAASGLPMIGTGNTIAANLPVTTGPFLNPHSLQVDDLPSPFPLPLTSSSASGSSGGASLGGAGAPGTGSGAPPGSGPNGARRRVKGGSGHPGQAIGGLGKSLLVLNVIKDVDNDADINEIRRGNKRRRAAVGAGLKI